MVRASYPTLDRTYINEILLDRVPDVEDVSREWVTGFIGVLKLRNLLVTSPYRDLQGVGNCVVVSTGQTKIDKIVLHRPFRTGSTPCIARKIALHYAIYWVERVDEESIGVHHDI